LISQCQDTSSSDDTESVRRHLAAYSKWRNIKKLQEKAVGDDSGDSDSGESSDSSEGLCGGGSSDSSDSVDSGDSDSVDDAERQVGDDDDSDSNSNSDSDDADGSCSSSDEFGNILFDDCASCNRCFCTDQGSGASDSDSTDSTDSGDSDDGGSFFGGFDSDSADAQVGTMTYDVSTGVKSSRTFFQI